MYKNMLDISSRSAFMPNHLFFFRSQMSDFVKNGSGFIKSLALGSVQHGAVIQSSLLPPTIGISEPMVSLAAG